MASTNFLYLPTLKPAIIQGAGSFTNTVLDANTEKVAWVFNVPEAIVITHLGFRYGVRAATPPTYRISLQAVDLTTGNPDGTVLGGGTPASGTFTPPASTAWNSTWQWVTLDNSYTTTRGQFLCIVIDYSSGTIDGTNNSSFTKNISGMIEARIFAPYSSQDTTGAWVKDTSGDMVFGYKSASAVYGWPLQASTTQNSAGDTTRVAMKFTLPAGFGSTFQIVGARVSMSTLAAAKSFKVGLWNGSGTALQDITVDSDVASVASNGIRTFDIYFDEVTLSTLDFGTTYYVGVEQVSTTTLSVNILQVAANNDLIAWPGGKDFYMSTWNGSAWSDTNTTWPWIMPILSDWTEPAGGGGGLLVNPGFTGRIL